MVTVNIVGGNPLLGNVRVSGAKNSVLKLIPAAMFSNDNVTIENVPRIGNVLSDLEIIKAIGGYVEWVGPNRLVLNGSGLNTYEIPYDLGSKYRTASLLAAPLIYRFGKALIPKPGGCRIGYRPINRWIETWKLMGIEVDEDDTYVRLEAHELHGADVSFKISTHSGTDNAILSAIAASGETIISNAAEESEVDDLIAFCNVIGAYVERIAPRKIKIVGTNVFGGGNFTVQGDKIEAATFAVAAIMTHGNITIQGVDKVNLTSFINVLTKMGCSYEFVGDEMRVWANNTALNPVNVTTAPAPGFLTDWQPLVTLLCTKSSGDSLLHDTVYTDRFGYIKDLNRMGAKIELYRPSELGITPVISDDAYDVVKLGEPYTVAKVEGPTKLRGVKMNIPDLRAGATLILAALTAEGRSEISGYENVSRGYENFIEKLSALGADISL